MKLGRITAFITAIVAVLATFTFLTPAMLANAEGETATYTSGYNYIYSYNSYDSNFIFGNLVKNITDDNKVDYESYKYSFSFAPAGDLDQAMVEAFLGTKVDEEKEGCKLSELQAKAAEKLSEKDLEVKVSNNKLNEKGAKSDIVFNYAGEYTATVNATATAEGKEDKTFAVKFTVVENVSAAALKPAYDFDGAEFEANLKAFAASVKEAMTVDFGEDFNLPEVNDLIKCNYYPATDAKLSMFYRAPENKSFSKNEVSTSSSSREFGLDAHGKYSFYVAVRDPFGKNTEVVNLNDYVYEKRSGDDKAYFYKEDEKMYYLESAALIQEEGDPEYNGVTVEYIVDIDGNKVYPLFSFDFYGTKAPNVILVQGEGQTHKAYQGLTYTNVSHLISVDIVAEGQTEYRLYFSKNSLSEDELDWGNAKEYVKDADGLMDITDVEEFKFDKSSKNFMVAEKGFYYVNCTAKNEFDGNTAYVVIDGNNTFTKIDYARDFGKDFSNFVKNNTVSVIFGCIALLSFIGLLLVIFIKPKEVKVEEDVNPVSKD